MSLVPWYSFMGFYFCISSISTSTLTYYDAWYQHDTLCELHEPLQSLTLNAQVFISHNTFYVVTPRRWTSDLWLSQSSNSLDNAYHALCNACLSHFPF